MAIKRRKCVNTMRGNKEKRRGESEKMEITGKGRGESEREQEQGLREQNLLKCSVVNQRQKKPLQKWHLSLCTDDRKRWNEVALFGVAIRKIKAMRHPVLQRTPGFLLQVLAWGASRCSWNSPWIVCFWQGRVDFYLIYLIVYLVRISSFWCWWKGELIYMKASVQTTWKFHGVDFANRSGRKIGKISEIKKNASFISQGWWEKGEGSSVKLPIRETPFTLE